MRGRFGRHQEVSQTHGLPVNFIWKQRGIRCRSFLRGLTSQIAAGQASLVALISVFFKDVRSSVPSPLGTQGV